MGIFWPCPSLDHPGTPRHSQKCTHLSCAVYYSQASNQLECPCHQGFFPIKDGAVLQGPPSRPLPRIVLETRGEQVIAVDVKV